MANSTSSVPNSPKSVPQLDGVPPALVAFLVDRFAQLEAKIESRFDILDDEIKALSSRVDDTQKSIRKLRRASSHDAGNMNQLGSSSPILSGRSSDSLTMRPRAKAAPTRPGEIAINLAERLDPYGGSDLSSPGTPKKSVLRVQIEEIKYSPEQLEKVAQGAKTLQHYLRTAIEVRKLASMKEMSEERTFVAQELYDTEKNYVQTLLTVQKVFMEPLNAAADSSKPILSKTEIRDIFGQIPVFYGINSEFLKVLTPLMAHWNPVTTQLGVVFIKNVAHFLKVYGAHIDTYSNHFNAIKSLIAKNTEFAKFVAEAEKKPECKMQDLPLMMLAVVQRITRYKILLTALQKATWPEHIDYPGLVQANEKISETTMMVNEKKRESEALKRLIEIQSLLQGADENLLVAPHRKFVAEVEGLWYPKRKRMILYLFNDSFLIVSISSSTGSHKLKQFCGLEGCRLSFDPEPRRLRIDAPLNHYVVEMDDITKKTAFLDSFNNTKSAFRSKLSSADTVNPRAMFNISHSSGNVSETLLTSYRRRPGSTGDLAMSEGTDGFSDSGSSTSSPPVLRGSPRSSKTLRKSPSAEITPSSVIPGLDSPSKSSKLARSASKVEKSRAPISRHHTDLPTNR